MRPSELQHKLYSLLLLRVWSIMCESTLYPQFRLGESRFDQPLLVLLCSLLASPFIPAIPGSFYGRLRHFLDVIDPRTLFVSENHLNECMKLLEQYKDGTLPTGVTNAQLWEAQKVIQAIFHPDTGEKIPMPFRMSGYIPFGTPVVVGLLLPNQTLASTIFWQWLNQSHNACVNYCNRNASKVQYKQCSLLKGAVEMYKWCCTSASVCNVLLMRHSELSEGISVLDDQGNIVATSKLAARRAVLETAVTRIVLPMPILVLPPMLMERSPMERLPLLQAHPHFVLPVHSLVCLCAFGLALPLAISLFPQNCQIHVSQLEPEIFAATECKILTYNKGL